MESNKTKKILMVDDDECIRSLLSERLREQGFDVTTAASVPDAIKLISANVYDVLLSDLHMPGAGDGLTVVSAMRHANPAAVTILLSAFPEMEAASQAILMQADQILVKPVNVKTLVDTIKDRLAFGPRAARVVETVAAILERAASATIDEWYENVQANKKVMAVALSYEQRTGYLHQVFRDLMLRLRSSRTIGGPELTSPSAAAHGLNRRQLGYTAAMMVEESRMLQVSIFRTLQKNLPNIDFSVLLIGVMTIADEIDSQLSQAMASYIQESTADALPA
jgi:DNA-binding response OmpR family regulator